MKPENLSELGSPDLEKIEKYKIKQIIDAIIVGFTIGIAIYSAVRNGFDFFTLFPLFLAYIVIKNSKNTKMLENEIRKEIDARR